ncbi:hypothetical protein [Pseudomonas sp. H9]|uniref:hypothetical protein n=1 Tax=Pseudomonas sp. H9 TaxID=483968 RepID=UPI001057A23B|nr:hypothetical protein [Pseudomonas sp. H9]TDF86386.1 hypothetical protein E1573_02130 [Pseudomonas sp. H9]
MDFSAPLKTYLAENTIITFAPALTAEERQDAMSLLLQARLFASNLLDSRIHWKSWMDRYRNRLEKHGCKLLSLITEPPRVIHSADELQGIAATVVGQVGDTELAEMVEHAIGRVRESGYAGRFFSKGENGGAFSEFVAVPCEKNQAGDILLVVFAVNIGLSVDVRDFDFWTETRRDMVVHVVGGLYRFERDTYAQYREAISTYIAESAKTRIRKLSITPKAR